MAIAVVQHAVTSAQTTTTSTVAMTGVGGSSSVLLFMNLGSAVSPFDVTIADTASTHYTWTLIFQQTADPVAPYPGVAIWLGTLGSGGTFNVQASWVSPSSPALQSGIALELTGIGNSNTLAYFTALGTPTAGSVNSPSIVPVFAGDLQCVFFAPTNSLTGGASSPWVDVTGLGANSGLSYQLNAAVGTPITAPGWSGVGPNGTFALGIDFELGLPPQAPVLTIPPNGMFIEANFLGVNFEGNYVPTNAGGGQTGWKFRIKQGSGAYQYWNNTTHALQGTEIVNTGSVLNFSILSGVLTNGFTYSWSFASRDFNGVGPYAADHTFVAQNNPTVAVSAPTGVQTTRNPVVNWTGTYVGGESQHDFRVITYTQAQYSAGGFVPGVGPSADDSGLVVSAANTYTVGLLPLNTNYRSYVFIHATTSNQGASSFTSFSVNALIPATLPIIQFQVAFDSEMLADVVAWTDVTRYLKSFDTNGGRQHSLARPEAAALSALFDNTDGRFSPTNVGSPYSATSLGGVPGAGLVPGKPCRILATWSGVTYPVYYGFVDTWAAKVRDAVFQEATLQAHDVFKLLALAYISNPSLFPTAVNIYDPIFYWRFSDPPGTTVVADASGNGNTGTGTPLPSGSMLASATFGGQDSTGAGFANLLSSIYSGSGSGAIVYDPATAIDISAPLLGPSISGSSGYTFSPASNPLVTTQPWSLMVLYQGNAGSCEGASFAHLIGDSVISIGCFYEATGPFNGQLLVQIDGTENFIPGAFINDGAWHQIVITSSGAFNGMKVYLDGVLKASIGAGINTTPYAEIEFGVDPSDFVDMGSTTSNISYTLQDAAIFPIELRLSDVLFLNGTQKYMQTIVSTGARIQEVLLITGYLNTAPGSFQFPNSIATGTISCQGETASQTQVTALDYILNVADTELGFFYQDPTGVLCFRDANWISTNPDSSSPQAQFADELGGGFLHYLPKSLKIPQDDQDLWTDVQIQAQQSPTSGGLEEAKDVSGIFYYGLRVLQRTGLLFASDADAATQAANLLAAYKNPLPRVSGFEATGESDQGASFPQMLGRQFWDQLTVSRQGPGETRWTQNSVIEGLQHKYDADPGRWHTIFNMSPYELL